jgi:hypothetical protein
MAIAEAARRRAGRRARATMSSAGLKVMAVGEDMRGCSSLVFVRALACLYMIFATAEVSIAAVIRRCLNDLLTTVNAAFGLLRFFSMFSMSTPKGAVGIW